MIAAYSAMVVDEPRSEHVIRRKTKTSKKGKRRVPISHGFKKGGNSRFETLDVSAQLQGLLPTTTTATTKETIGQAASRRGFHAFRPSQLGYASLTPNLSRPSLTLIRSIRPYMHVLLPANRR